MAHPLFDFSHLTAAERARLATDLWDSIALERADELSLPEEHRAELARRLEAYRRDPDAGASWEGARERVLARLNAVNAKRGR